MRPAVDFELRTRRALARDLWWLFGKALASLASAGQLCQRGAAAVGRRGEAIERVPRCHLDIIGNARDALDAMHEFTEGRGDQHLALPSQC